MLKRTISLFNLPIYPLALAYFPLLDVYTHNLSSISFDTTLSISAVILALTILTWFILNLWMRDKQKAGLLTSLLMLFLLTYGHSFNLLESTVQLDDGFPKNKLVMGLQLILVVATAWFLKRKTSQETASKLANIASVIAMSLYLFPLYALSTTLHALTLSATDAKPYKKAALANYKSSDVTYPDMYYLMLDGYGREDVLRQNFGFDNHALVQELKGRDFYVADSSFSNYSQTMLSSTATLNLNYLHELYESNTVDLGDIAYSFQNNQVIAILKSYGYYTVSTASGFDFTKLKTHMQLSPAFSFNEFESAILTLTPIPPLMNNASLNDFLNKHAAFFNLYETHRSRMLYAFSSLNKVNKPQNRPIFVFSHILIAHPPFVFDEFGHPTNTKAAFSLDQPPYKGNDAEYQEQYVSAYQKQVKFGNKLLVQAIDSIMMQDKRKKVIIVQGDHGPYSLPLSNNATVPIYKERMSILNAYYFSDGGPKAVLYNKISPVNTFRVIFNYYLNKNYTVLEDRAYFSSHEDRFDYHDVTKFIN